MYENQLETYVKESDYTFDDYDLDEAIRVLSFEPDDLLSDLTKLKVLEL